MQRIDPKAGKGRFDNRELGKKELESINYYTSTGSGNVVLQSSEWSSLLLIVGNLVKDKQDLENKVLYLENMNSALSRMIPPKVSSLEDLSSVPSEQREMSEPSVPSVSSNDSSRRSLFRRRKLDSVSVSGGYKKKRGRKTPRSNRRKLTRKRRNLIRKRK